MEFCRYTYGVRAVSLSDLEVSDSVGFLVAAPKLLAHAEDAGELRQGKRDYTPFSTINSLEYPGVVVCLPSLVDYEISPATYITHPIHVIMQFCSHIFFET